MSTPSQVSASVPDWSRERSAFDQWQPASRLLQTIRTYQRLRHKRNPLALLMRKLCVLRYHFWSAITGTDIPLTLNAAGGLLLPHPNGIVIHPQARIGPNCLLFQQVTLGLCGNKPGAPTLGGHVDVGAGAKILGGVMIGDHAKIGANAVVLTDVPPGATAVGIPARIILPPLQPRADNPLLNDILVPSQHNEALQNVEKSPITAHIGNQASR